MNKLSLLKNSVEISQLTRGAKVFSICGCKDISSALCQLNVVGNFLGALFVIDTHVIREELGGNGNDTIITFGKVEHCVQWLLKRLHWDGLRENSMQEIIKVYISNDVTQISKMMNLHTHLVIQRKKSQNLSLINMDDAEYANLTTAEKSNLSHWNDLE